MTSVVKDFFSIAELNTIVLENFAAKNVEFSELLKARIINHFENDTVRLTNGEYKEKFTEVEENSYVFNNTEENYSIYAEGDLDELFEQSKEFNMLFELPEYFEDVIDTSGGVLRSYFISDDRFLVAYPVQAYNDRNFQDFYGKYMYQDSKSVTTGEGAIYIYEVHDDALTGDRILSIHTPVAISGVFKGTVVVDIYASAFASIVLDNYSSFLTDNNLEDLIYYKDENQQNLINYTKLSGNDLINDFGIDKRFYENSIDVSKYTGDLSVENKLYYSNNMVIYKSTLDSVQLDYYQVASLEYSISNVNIQLFLLLILSITLVVLFVILIISRIKVFALNKQIEGKNVLEEKLINEVNTDPVTGLRNDRYLLEEFKVMNENTEKYYSIILCDISFYSKAIHKYGDKVAGKALLRFIDIVYSFAKDDTLIVRWNEEELIVVLFEVDEEGAIAVADEIRKAASVLMIENDREDSSRVFISCGVSINRNMAINPMKTLEEASKAMVTSRQRGGNIVTVYSKK
ncbi:MAG: diguanylate cyclase domain-containing protein [Lachnospirales bacterium]